MLRSLFGLLILCSLIGCRAPAPSFSPFASSGATRIEPPRTGSYGMPDPYYQHGTSANEKSGSSLDHLRTVDVDIVAASDEELPARRGTTDDLAWTAPNSRVIAAGYEEEITDDDNVSGSRGISSSSIRDSRRGRDNNPFSIIPATAANDDITPRTDSSIRFRGMPVNDASDVREPVVTTRSNETILEISELPEPSPAVRARLRGMSGSSARAGTNAAPSDLASARNATSSTNGGWTGR